MPVHSQSLTGWNTTFYTFITKQSDGTYKEHRTIVKAKLHIRKYQDAKHAWYAVKRVLLEKFGLLDKVSVFSYERGGTVYLEEDCDGKMFTDYLISNNIPYTVELVRDSDISPIRGYPCFDALRQIGLGTSLKRLGDISA